MISPQQRYDLSIWLLSRLEPYLPFSHPIMQRLYLETFLSPEESASIEEHFNSILVHDMLSYSNTKDFNGLR